MKLSPLFKRICLAATMVGALAPASATDIASLAPIPLPKPETIEPGQTLISFFSACGVSTHMVAALSLQPRETMPLADAMNDLALATADGQKELKAAREGYDYAFAYNDDMLLEAQHILMGQHYQNSLVATLNSSAKLGYNVNISVLRAFPTPSCTLNTNIIEQYNSYADMDDTITEAFTTYGAIYNPTYFGDTSGDIPEQQRTKSAVYGVYGKNIQPRTLSLQLTAR